MSEYKKASNGRFDFNQHKDYKTFYTYFSKRGYYVASSKIGDFAFNGQIEVTGNTANEAIGNLKLLIGGRIETIKKYYTEKVQQNEDVISDIENTLAIQAS